VKNALKRQRKRFLLSVGAKYFPSRLLLNSVCIFNWDDMAVLGPHETDRLNKNIDGLTNLTVIEAGRKYPIVSPRHRKLLKANGLPETQIYSVPRFTCELADATLQLDDGIVCTRDMQLLEDSAIGRRRIMISSAYGELKPKSNYLKGTYSSIWGRHGNNHYHWLFEELPRLYSLQSITKEPVTLLMPDNLLPSYKLSLNWCLPEHMSVEYVPHGSWLRLERFIFPSYVLDSNIHMPPEASTRHIRSSMLEGAGLQNQVVGGIKRIYVSRHHAPFRRMKNEDSIIAMLGSYGFEAYVLEDLSLEEQIHLFHDAECVVAPHGAGIANMLFAGAIPLVELTSPYLPVCYFTLAHCLGQEYRYVYSLPDPKVQRHTEARLLDFVIPVDDVEREVQEALASPLLRSDV
jgi:Glycosyltransferase 61